ncbi:unnamed protein product [Linum tenue]|uniref:Uncharacterized protein n=2 Tax=Linum tenue TaxID=586396 RepID=A0AAV0JMS7_9ROSI|nr:unnamed protein product [Linum tenue]
MAAAAASSLLLALLLSLATAQAWEALPLQKRAFYSPSFSMAPGSVAFDYFYDVEFPRGHLALKSFRADVVDADDNVIPYHEVYLHHSYIVRYYQARNDGFIYRRNHGICQGDLLGQYFGLGTEMQSTPTAVPDPYGIEIGNPAPIPHGFDEKWLLVVHAIDTRGAVDRFGCAECRRDLYNVTVDQFGEPLKDDYYGGLSCCYAHTQCKVREDYEGTTRSLRMRYTLTWTEWVPSIIPVRVYIFDVTDDMKLVVNPSSGAVAAKHDCLIEYMVESCHVDGNGEKGCADFKKSIVAMPKGGNVIFGLTHLHSGAINSTLYGQDGRVLCTTKPIYGEGMEEGYIVGMSTCYPEPGSVWIDDGELMVHESVYTAERRRTGVMALFYLLVADRVADTPAAPAGFNDNYFMGVRSMLAEKLAGGGGGAVRSGDGGASGAFVGVGLVLLGAVATALLLRVKRS